MRGARSCSAGGRGTTSARQPNAPRKPCEMRSCSSSRRTARLASMPASSASPARTAWPRAARGHCDVQPSGGMTMSDKREPQRTPSKLAYEQSGQRMQDQAARDPMALMRRQVADHQAFLKAKMPQIERWVTGGVDARALVRFAVLDLSAPGYAGDKLREC